MNQLSTSRENPTISDREPASHLYSIRWDAEIGAVQFRWHEFASGQKFRAGAWALLEYFRDAEASKLLVDARNITAHDNPDQRWLVNDWMPKMIDAGLEYSVTVHRDDAFAQAEMQGLLLQLDSYDVSSTVTADMNDARAWLAEK